jgi:hypothetical protein
MGIKVPPTDDEVKEMVKAKAQKRMEDYNKMFEKLKERTTKEGATVSPLLEEKDLKLVAAEQANLT